MNMNNNKMQLRQSLPVNIKNSIKETKNTLNKLFSGICKIILFGFYAKGDFSEYSDIDLLIIFNELKDKQRIRDKYSQRISEICLKYNCVVTIVLTKKEHFYNAKNPLFLNIIRIDDVKNSRNLYKQRIKY